MTQSEQADTKLISHSWADHVTPSLPGFWPRHRLPTFEPTVVLPAFILVVALACALAPAAIAPFAATDMDTDAILNAPSLQHLLGTDHFGRDILSLLIYGASQTLLLGGCAVLLGLTIGGSIGLLAGYAGGFVDMVLMRLIDLWGAIPPMLMAIILAIALGPSLTNLIIAVGLVMVPRFTRVMRARVLMVSRQAFVEASRSIGSPPLSIVLRHILPHTLGPMLVMITLGVAEVIIFGASLSFIGLGVIDDRPDWGFLLNQGKNYVAMAWWFATFPGLAISAVVISVNMLGEALRGRLDPRSLSH
jgi:peptide/nickel transport system permease protein